MKFRLGTRGSALALAQTKLFCSEFQNLHRDSEIEIVQITTTGDSKQGTQAATSGDKRDWIHELELAVVSGEIDFALHSSKDIPCEIHEKTELLSVLKRGNPYDLFIGKLDENGERVSFKNLARGSSIGTGSLRRQAQLLRLRPDLQISPIRGNITTRVRKLDEDGLADGIVLAAAGIERVGTIDVKGEELSPEALLPAVNQGTLAVQFNSEGNDLKGYLQSLVDADTQASFLAERATVIELDGDCRSAIGVFAEIDGEELKITSRVFSHCGSTALSASANGAPSEASALGTTVGRDLLKQGARELLFGGMN